MHIAYFVFDPTTDTTGSNQEVLLSDNMGII